MSKHLKCLNKDCESNVENHLDGTFDLLCVVDSSGGLAEPISKIDGQHFTCTFCGDIAEWVNFLK